MTILRIALCAAVLALSAASTVQAGDKPQTIQQPGMMDCNQQAGDKTGDDRQAFMATCLQDQNNAGANANGNDTQQQKIASCNQQAEGKRGKERKAFMSACLK